MTESWGALVERGRELVRADLGETRFELGDCALAVEGLKTRGHSDGSWKRLAEYAETIGIAFETLRQYRAVSAAYPNGMRHTFCPWSVHQALMGEPDRAELVQRKWWTLREIAALKRERRPKVAPKRDERWWKAVQEEVAALRRWDGSEGCLRPLGPGKK